MKRKTRKTKMRPKVTRVISKLIEKFGNEHDKRIRRGVKQVAGLWTIKDGTPEKFEEFCLKHFVAGDDALKALLARFERNLEQIDGLSGEIDRFLDEPVALDLPEPLPIDEVFAAFFPAAGFVSNLFDAKVAFAALLNFPLYTTKELWKGEKTRTREEWAAARLSTMFSLRGEPSVIQKLNEAYLDTERYISSYNIYMHNLVTADGERLFPEGMKLLSHWGLRDEIKAQYSQPDGFARQCMIYEVVKRIVRQEIPKIVINNPDVLWDPFNNIVVSAKTGELLDKAPEPNTRYERLLGVFQAEKACDRYYGRTFIDRKFFDEREIKEEDLKKLLISVMKAPVAKDIAEIIKRRLDRKLRPFDIWYYDEFIPRDAVKLDPIVKARYPDVSAFQADLPRILTKLGFAPEKAEFLASQIVVDACRGSGHALPAERREDKMHLRTRFTKSGMDYKGFEVAMHELGHGVEQVFSLHLADHSILAGVPNNAFTECFAFFFEDKLLDVLGVENNDPFAEENKALREFWRTFEICGVGLLDMAIWHWMYKHPKATPAELREAVEGAIKEIWNEYYAPVLGMKFRIIPAIYSHLVNSGLYTPDYGLGHIVAFQVREFFKGKNWPEEIERMCKTGSVTPNRWMQEAIGCPISSETLIKAAEEAVKKLNGK